MTRTITSEAPVDSAGALDQNVRDAARDLILTLADNKRLLGIRYSDWMLGAPTLETGIAASSMAQDEWGHSRLTYSLLSDFGEDPKKLEHDREAAEYHSSELLDAPFSSWSEMIAASLLFDSAVTLQYGALLDSRYQPVHNRVEKLLDEEAFHFQYATGWVRRLAAAPQLRPDLEQAVARLLPIALRWLGQDESEDAHLLVETGIVAESPSALRNRLLARVGPKLDAVGMAESAGIAHENGTWRFDGSLNWQGWDDRRHRSGGSGPGAETLARVRGDKNRAMLLD